LGHRTGVDHVERRNLNVTGTPNWDPSAVKPDSAVPRDKMAVKLPMDAICLLLLSVRLFNDVLSV
jgi:hypothetical protein